jgi:hypothetical protein
MNCSHIEAVATETVARSARAPGGWGAEESGTRSEPGPEATVASFAGQLGTCLAEIWLHYDWSNEAVITAVQNAAGHRRTDVGVRRSVVGGRMREV